MERDKENEQPAEKPVSDRRSFLKFGLMAGGAFALSAFGADKVMSSESGDKAKVLTADDKVVEVDKSHLKNVKPVKFPEKSVRTGMKGKKFVMVIDLSRCEHALECQKACTKMHHTEPHQEYLKVLKMKDSEKEAPYWLPKPCFHCDEPPCVKVCPVGATFKRDDGIVLIDNTRCVGCRFCMAACPYSTRVFNWKHADVTKQEEKKPYSPETGFPARMGTVAKCDFCPDELKRGELPKCVSACPNSVYYFGDANEDAVSNGDTTVRLSQLLKDKAGYRLYESLGTEPSVYYLPPVDRMFKFKDAPNDNDEKTQG